MNGRRQDANTPFVANGELYNAGDYTGLKLNTPSWITFVWDHTRFYYYHGHTYQQEGMSVRSQPHRNGFYWYAYKRIHGRLRKLYIGPPEAVTELKLAATYERFNHMIHTNE